MSKQQNYHGKNATEQITDQDNHPNLKRVSYEYLFICFLVLRQAHIFIIIETAIYIYGLKDSQVYL
jgi:hypothetical protein